MSNIKNVFSSITYYKKYNLILFLFFTSSLLGLTWLTLLDATRELKVSEISARWQTINHFLPGMKEDGFDIFSTASYVLKLKYQLFTKLAVTGIGLLLVTLTGTLLFKRKQDIKSLLSLGIKKWHVALQLIIEALFPIVFSFCAVLAFVLIFQSSFKAVTISTNNQLFSAELPYTISFAEQSDTNTLKESDKKNILLPFNENSFYYVEASDSVFYYHKMFSAISLNFLFLLLFSFILITLTTTMIVAVIGKSMYY